MSMPTGSPSRKSPVGVFHIDDHAVMRIGLQQLRSQRGFEICGEAGDPDSAFSGIERSNPDLALVDLILRGYDGIQLLHDLHEHWPTIPLVAYTMHEDPSDVERASADCTGRPDRPRETLALLAEGFSVSEIAANLRLSRKTVETHCTRLCEHFGIDGPRGLARLAIQRKQ